MSEDGDSQGDVARPMGLPAVALAQASELPTVAPGLPLALSAAMLTLTLCFMTLTQAPPARDVAINGARLTGKRLEVLERLENRGARLPNGTYWYDSSTGAFGLWNGPTALWLPPGLDLGPPCPLTASGGRTNVVVNGRALHPLEALHLAAWIQRPLLPGRYRIDARGNLFLENGAFLANLFVLAAMARGGASGSTDSTFSALSGQGTSQAFSAIGSGSFMGACTKGGACAYTGD